MIVIGNEVIELALRQPSGIAQLQIKHIPFAESRLHLSGACRCIRSNSQLLTSTSVSQNNRGHQHRERDRHGDIAHACARRAKQILRA